MEVGNTYSNTKMIKEEMTKEEMIKEMTNVYRIHHEDTEETITKRYNNWKKAIKASEEKGWILIGEVEWGDYFPFGKFREEEPYFLFMRADINHEEIKYIYSFSKNFCRPLDEGWGFVFNKRYSINTILTFFISQDLQFQGMGNPVLKSKYLKMKLVGNKDWLYPDVDFLNRKIDMDELEKKFRSDKAKNQYFLF